MTDVRDMKARRLIADLPDGIQIVDDKDGSVLHESIVDSKTNRIKLMKSWMGTPGNNTGGGTNPDTPTAGDDYFAGDINKGEISEMTLAATDPMDHADPTKPVNAALLIDPGSKANMIGDGFMFYLHLQKTLMTKGTKGDTTDLPLNYDPKNVAKDGYFTTTSPVPAFIKATSFIVGQKLTIPLAGIGENLNGKNVKIPTLDVAFNADKTLTLQSETGYDNDGDSAGATGANYDVIVDSISTFSAQDAVAQLPDGILVFSGDAGGEIALTAVNDYFTNVSGLKIVFDDYIHWNNTSTGKSAGNYSSISDFGISNTIILKRNQLIKGNKIRIASKINTSTTRIGYTSDGTSSKLGSSTSSFFAKQIVSNDYVQINESTVNIPLTVWISEGTYDWTGYIKVKSVTTWKEGD